MRRILGTTQFSVKAFIYGKEGTRKSNVAIQFATLKNREGKPLRVLYIDTEYKSVEGFNEDYLIEKGVDLMNVCEIRSRNLDDIQTIVDRFTQGKPIQQMVTKEFEVIHPETFKKIKVDKEVFTNEFELDAEGKPFIADVLVIDSLSIINDLYIEGRYEVVKIRTNIKIADNGLTGDKKAMAVENMGLQLLDYNKLQMKAKKMIRDLQAVTGKHVVYICRAKDAKKSEDVIEDGKKKIVSIDLGYEIMDSTSFKFLPFETNLNLHTSNKDGVFTVTVEKDCTNIHKEREVLSSFDISEYASYINNEKRTQIHKTVSYEENLKVAKDFTEESDEVDLKFGIHKTIMEKAKEDKVVADKVKAFFKANGLNPVQASKAELLSMDMILKMREECLPKQ